MIRKLTMLFLPAVVALTWPAAESHASTISSYYNVKKQIAWEIDNPGASGWYRYAYHCLAHDRNGRDCHEAFRPGQAGADFPLQGISVLDAVSNPYMRYSPLEFHDDLYWSHRHNWAVTNGLNETVDVPPAFTGKSLAVVDKLNMSAALIQGNQKRMTSSIELEGWALATANQDPETAAADSFACAEIGIPGQFLSGEIQNGTAPPQKITVAHPTLSLYSRRPAVLADGKSKADYHDPLHMAIYDSVTHDLVAEQDLFAQNWSTTGNASASWDDTDGLRLISDPDSTAGLEILTLGDWVLNPFDGTAKIENGQFITTGDFATFDWDIVEEPNGTLHAILPASAFPTAMELLVQPTGLLSQRGNDLDVELSSPAEPYAYDDGTTPEPTTLVLLAAGGLMMCRRRR